MCPGKVVTLWTWLVCVRMCTLMSALYIPFYISIFSAEKPRLLRWRERKQKTNRKEFCNYGLVWQIFRLNTMPLFRLSPVEVLFSYFFGYLGVYLELPKAHEWNPIPRASNTQKNKLLLLFSFFCDEHPYQGKVTRIYPSRWFFSPLLIQGSRCINVLNRISRREARNSLTRASDMRGARQSRLNFRENIHYNILRFPFRCKLHVALRN